ncbi:MAG: hypothetical protein QNJ32_20190 [Xenococcaceae cyanobacterium MO_167.B27]|nr:hypothetical protein [Xenococcaceae cyanobacterium MO_167.B27]
MFWRDWSDRIEWDILEGKTVLQPHYQIISKIEQQLLAQFHNLTFFQHRLSANK